MFHFSPRAGILGFGLLVFTVMLWLLSPGSALATSGVSGNVNSQLNTAATQGSTIGAASSTLANRNDPNTIVSTETLRIEVASSSDPGATPTIQARITSTLAGTAVTGDDYIVFVRVYQCNSSCGTNSNWSQVGSDASSTVHMNAAATDTGLVTITGTPQFGKSGDITFYSVLAWSRDRQGTNQTNPASADLRVNARSDQSTLTFSSITTNKTNYAPTNGTSTDAISFSGVIAYTHGAIQSDYDGTAETVTLTFKDQDGATVSTSSLAVTDATGAFSTSLTLPDAAEFGQWTITTDYSHNGDSATNDKTFLVDLAISNITFQLFNNDNASNSLETANTGTGNLGVPVRVTATAFNNPDAVSLSNVQLQWIVPTPPATTTFSAATSTFSATVTAPTGSSNAGSRSLRAAGTATNGGQTVNVSSTISGFSDRAITLSVTLNVTNIFKAKLTTDSSESETFVISADNLFTKTEVKNVRSQVVSGKTVAGILRTPAGATNTSWTHSSTTQADGFTDFKQLSVVAPAGTWTVQSDASDGSGNSGTRTENLIFASAFAGNYLIQAVGWNQTRSIGETATFTIQTMSRDSDSVFQPIAADSAPKYRIRYWDGSTWQELVATSNMTSLAATGTYEATYAIANDSAWIGRRLAITFDATISGTALPLAEEIEIVGSPAQVVINSVTDATVPTISASVRITNEGTIAFEYTYEWCVVTVSTNECGGGDDVDYGSAAKLIQAGNNFDTTLTLNVVSTGTYYFKAAVWWSNQSSKASRQFTAGTETVTPSPSPSSSGGGGGTTPESGSASVGRSIPCGINDILCRLAAIEERLTKLERRVTGLEGRPVGIFQTIAPSSSRPRSFFKIRIY